MIRRTFSALLAVSLMLLPMPTAQAQTTALDACPFPPGNLVVAYAEPLTVSTTAIGLTASVYNPGSGSPKAVCALITVNTNGISRWVAGRTPTASDGALVAAGVQFSVGPANLATLKMIRSGASDASVAVEYMVPTN